MARDRSVRSLRVVARTDDASALDDEHERAAAHAQLDLVYGEFGRASRAWHVARGLIALLAVAARAHGAMHAHWAQRWSPPFFR